MTNVYFRTRGMRATAAAALAVIGLTAFLFAPMATVYAQSVPQDVPADTSSSTSTVATDTPDASTATIDAAESADQQSSITADNTSDGSPTDDTGPKAAAALSLPSAASDVPATGTITVCKVVLDANGALTAGDAGSTFSVSVTDAAHATVGTATFTTPLAYSADVMSDIPGNDAQCQTFNNLALDTNGATTFAFSAETTNNDSLWQAPRYATIAANAALTSTGGELKPYVSDSATITLTAGASAATAETLVVVNQLKAAEKPPVENSCVLPDTLGDTTPDAINDSGESTVQQILNNNGYSAVDASADQRQYQTWHVVAGQTVTVDATFLDKIAGHGNVFGYYTNGNLDSFVPLFKKGDAAGNDSVPTASTGDSYMFTVPAGATDLGFAIKSYDNGSLTAVIATQNSLNDGSADNVVAYNPSSNEYILGFEDLLTGSDYDFNDMVVSIHIDCTGNGGGGGDNGGGGGSHPQCSDGIDNDGDHLIDSADPGCHTDGDASNAQSYDANDNDETDQFGTGGGSLQCIDGIDNDGDGLIDSADPGCHTDNNANNPASYDPTDNDETDVPPPSHSSGSSHYSSSGGSVPSTPTVLGAQACSEYIHSYIKWGKENDSGDVSRLQTFLNDYMHDSLAVSGIFDAPTFDALKAFQLHEKSQVLVPWVGITLPNADQGTGWLYKTTKRWINMIKCPELNIPMPQLTIDPQDL